MAPAKHDYDSIKIPLFSHAWHCTALEALVISLKHPHCHNLLAFLLVIFAGCSNFILADVFSRKRG
jgi:hypothetical protein